MILSGGQFGGNELESLSYEVIGDNFNIEGWLYTKDGIFNGFV